MIGKMIRAKIEEDFSYDQLIGLCEMINKAYLSDLKALAKKEGEPGPAWNDVNLEGVGIKKSTRTEEINEAIKTGMEMIERKIPVINSSPTRIDLARKPIVPESGLTEAGAMLRRILRDY